MSALTTALAAEHTAFEPRIEELRRLADDSAAMTPGALLDRLDAVVDFLSEELLPHSHAEERILYPAIGDVLGSSEATATMARDHAEIARLVEQLRHHRDELASQVLPVARHEVVRLLYALHAVVSLHVAKEDELYLPLLADRVPAERARDLLHAMHRAVELPFVEPEGLNADGG